MLFSGGPAVAQDQSGDAIEEVVVTGIRGSLQSSISMKRNSDVIVDGISAEDIGVFPDQNVAESLQRITGVSIDRSGGDGHFVTVRGLGPQFNNVLANGRMLATENSGREFSLDVLPSELINGAVVYKTSRADLTEGAIGGTINMTTWRPFDIAGQKIVASLAGTYDSNSEENDYRASGLYSNRFADDTVGFLASFSYSERTASLQSQFSDGYPELDFDTDGDGIDDLFGVKTIASNRYQVFNQDRERLGGTLALQWRPNDNHDITFDALYSRFNVKDDSIELAIPFSVGGPSKWENIVVNSDNLMISGTQDNQFIDIVQQSLPRTTETYQIGFNDIWQLSDRLTMISDIAYSEATSDNLGDRRFYVVRAFAPVSYSMGSEIPLVNVAADLTQPDIWSSHVVQNRGIDTSDDVLEAKADFELDMDLGAIRGLKSGIYFSDREKDVVASRLGVCGRCYNNAKVMFTDSSIFSPFTPSNFLEDISGDFTNAWSSYSYTSVTDFHESEAALSQLSPADRANVEALLASGGFDPQPDDGATANVTEQTWATYIQLDLGGETGGLEWQALFGGRLIHTEQVSTGQFVEIIELEDLFNPDGTVENRLVTFSEPEFVGFDNSYTEFLPNFSFRLDLHEDVVLRAGYSQTLTRPTISSLSTRVTYSTNVGAERVSGQNPFLEPFKSKNYAASLEWYFSEVGALTAAFFFKELESFVTIDTEQIVILGVDFAEQRPRNGGEGTITGFELAYQQVFQSGFGVQANYTYIDSTADFSNLGGATDLTVEGLSQDNYNLIAFYETDRIGLRLAYNYCDDFLSSASSFLGGSFSTEAYGQLDFRGSYNITEQFQVYVDLVNLTDETRRQFYNFDKAQPVGYEDFGAKWRAFGRAIFS